MMAVSIVTAPPRAKTRPSIITPAPTVIDTAARMLPRNAESAPSVAELPSCQKTLQAWAVPTRLTMLFAAVMTVVAERKMKIASGSPCASSVTVPVMSNVPDNES
jgi:hypothetical protein